jgi:hypothetical protein
MTIKRYAGDKLVGLSSDTKPTNIPDGATFYETDTLTPFLLVSGAWSEVGVVTADPVLTLAGDATGTATFTNLGNATLTVAVVDDSHSHSFNNLLNKTSGTGNYTSTGTFTGATFNATSTVGGGFQGIDADSATVPSFTWTSDQNTGIWHAAADSIGFTTGGVNRLTISTTAITSTLPITASLSGNATTATTLQTARNINLGGVLSGSASFNGAGDITITAAHTSDPVITLTGAVTGAGTMTNLGSVSITTTATADPVLTLAGDATGTATFTNLGNATLTVAVVDDSHGHSFNNLLNKTSGTGNYTSTGTFTGATFNATSTVGGGFQGIDADSITVPSFTWTSDQNTGIWHPAADQIGFTTGGTNRLTISTTAITSTLPITASLVGNATTATTLETARNINLGGVLSGSASFNGGGDITITAAHTSDPVITLTGAVTGTGTMTNLGSVSITTTATADPILTLAGDATGTATFTNLGNATLTVAVVDDSHGHSFNNLLNKTGGTGDYTSTGTFTGATFNATSTTNGGFQGIDVDTITAPSFTWTSDQNTGIWHPAADQIGFTTGGTNRLTISTSAITSTLPITASLSGNATTATTLQTARTINLGGVLSGSASFNGAGDITITAAHTSDPVITLTGDVTGTGTMTNLGSVSIATTVSGGGGSALVLYAENPSTPTAPSATGLNGVAIGSGAIASGSGAVALTKSQASGTESFATSITTNSASYGSTGAYSFTSGRFSLSQGAYSFVLGSTNLASSNFSGVIGTSSVSDADYAIAVGSEAKSSILYKYAYAGGSFGADGQAQTGTFVLRSDTTGATAEALTTNNSTAGTTNQVILPNNTAYAFSGTIVARQSAVTGTACAAWKIEGLIRREGTAGTTVLVNSATTILDNTPGWGMALSADTTNGGLKIEVTGAAATNIRWVATINTSEVTY